VVRISARSRAIFSQFAQEKGNRLPSLLAEAIPGSHAVKLISRSHADPKLKRLAHAIQKVRPGNFAKLRFGLCR